MFDSAGPAEERTGAARTGAASDEPAGSRGGHRRRSPGRRILRWLLYLLYLVVLLEVGSRVYWKVKHGMPFFADRGDWYGWFYGELGESKVLETDLRGHDDRFDVLFLGGSVLYYFDCILGREQKVIQKRLQRTTRREVRTFNLAYMGMTTRDSLTKYRLMDEYDKHFDLVVVYQGINETRMNSCPAARFRDNYAHAAFYDQLERMEAQAWLLPFFRLPFTIEYAVIEFMDSDFMNNRGFKFYIPVADLVSEAWAAYGTDIKTEGAFRESLRGIIQLARHRGEPVLLMTLAWYIPEGYTCEKFRAGQLDFAWGDDLPGKIPVEMWGTVEAVTKGLKVHNRVIRELAAANKDVLFVDAEALIPKEGSNFRDVCHLTSKGNGLLLQAMAQGIERFLRERKQDSGRASAGAGR